MATDSPFDGPADRGDREPTGAPIEVDGARRGAGGLRHEVVSYPDRPDQCTIFPPEATGVTRMSTWLTADRGAFVDLSTVR
ncbi:DUF7511 domain-containing protein [Natronoarchaeum rubrum]|uniref:DUF7511 domain-containing protein n=1 Tax=Natronoarchaeum rubrum TaxID=755311 RepID=UPI0021131923|nr:hypothetical protein [Natronoarchaeum rubrum]